MQLNKLMVWELQGPLIMLLVKASLAACQRIYFYLRQASITFSIIFYYIIVSFIYSSSNSEEGFLPTYLSN